MELLMWLNIFGGRSYNDLSQYPIIPWILCNNNKEKIKEIDLKENKKKGSTLLLMWGKLLEICKFRV